MSVDQEPGAVTARLVIAPRIGPAHGVQTSPRPTPVTQAAGDAGALSIGASGCPSVRQSGRREPFDRHQPRRPLPAA